MIPERKLWQIFWFGKYLETSEGPEIILGGNQNYGRDWGRWEWNKEEEGEGVLCHCWDISN